MRKVPAVDAGQEVLPNPRRAREFAVQESSYECFYFNLIGQQAADLMEFNR